MLMDSLYIRWPEQSVRYCGGMKMLAQISWTAEPSGLGGCSPFIFSGKYTLAPVQALSIYPCSFSFVYVSSLTKNIAPPPLIPDASLVLVLGNDDSKLLLKEIMNMH